MLGDPWPAASGPWLVVYFAVEMSRLVTLEPSCLVPLSPPVLLRPWVSVRTVPPSSIVENSRDTISA